MVGGSGPASGPAAAPSTVSESEPGIFKMGGAQGTHNTVRSDTFDFALAPHLLGWRNEIQIRQFGLKASDFEMFKVIGISMFGWVRMGKHKPSGNYVAIKCMRKTEIMRLKQVRSMQVNKDYDS